MSIKILSDNLINKIAAGEVVERPASVVKELVENALDAGADFITVELKNGGIDLIEITDNGKGMGRQDAKMCVERHATSKINTIEDLYNISTFGFRGEALSAISSVSRFSLQTKERGAVVGTVVNNWNNTDDDFSGSSPERSNTSPGPSSERRGKDNADEWEIKDVGCPDGTKIRVADLFYNVPARRKFLKSIPTEFNHILNILTNMALVNFYVRFKLIHNGKVIFDYLKDMKIHEADDNTKIHERGNENTRNDTKYKIMDDHDHFWKERVKMILGAENFSHIFPFNKESGEMIVQGFVSDAAFTKMNRSQQYIFVNNRPVNNNIVQKAIYEAYRNLIPRDSHPMFILKIDIEPELVDVNVHPRKLEVKFLHQNEVFKIIGAIIREVIAGSSRQAGNEEGKLYGFSPQNTNFILSDRDKSQSTVAGGYKYNQSFFPPRSEKLNNQTMDFNREMFFSESSVPFLDSPRWQMLGQVKNAYLIVSTDKGILIIDQHAAHERMLYDKLEENLKKNNFKAQPLLSPLKLDITLHEMEIMKKNLEILKSIGFDMEEFGANTIIVQAVPQDAVKANMPELVRGLIHDLNENDEIDNPNDALEQIRIRVIKYLACHSAVKGGDYLDEMERKALISKIMDGTIKNTCPHGRPIMVEITFDEIEKKLKRKN